MTLSPAFLVASLIPELELARDEWDGRSCSSPQGQVGTQMLEASCNRGKFEGPHFSHKTREMGHPLFCALPHSFSVGRNRGGLRAWIVCSKP
jgi:hypothetical protein